ncbi:Uncharacterised protein [Salmonella enterica subsp. enterica serovar Bovismorbificans]|nr:Uncharacterised protein [Salmonella enterica subsp. enterica serovar Bovismorbificans]CNU30947.1 Uncharacterised protein [Salmonella enterica subsp. enterica serovar Bovismorbificans]CQB64091.1 Uncharacterised protein [Salmonella enterica subsp. enterica serovar Bovismorbificans]
MRVIDLQQVINFALFNFYRFRIAFIFDIGCANDRKLFHPRNDKDDTLIFVLQNIRLLLIMDARHDDMAAFDQADAIWRRQVHPFVEELFDPRSGGVNQSARLPDIFFTGVDIFRFDNPQAIFPTSGGCASTGKDFAAFTHHHLCVSQHQTRIVYPAVGIFESAHDFRFEHRICAKPHTGGTG